MAQVELRKVAPIREIELNAGERNLLNPQNMMLLRQALTDADEDPSVEAIVLAASGSTFCGGLDIPAITEGADPMEFAAALVALLQAFPRLTKPVAAAIQGDAMASGAALVASVDFAVCVPTARIGSQEVSVGIWPMVAQVPLVHRIGVRSAMENIGCGDPFTAIRAREVGLVQEVAEPGELMERVIHWLNRARRGRDAYRLGRPSLYELAELDYGTALDAALRRFGAMFDDRR